jgi:hypothetical protein
MLSIILLITLFIMIFTDIWPLISLQRWYQVLIGLGFATVVMLIQYAALGYWFMAYGISLPLELLATPSAIIIYGTICLAMGLLLHQLIIWSIRGATWLKHYRNKRMPKTNLLSIILLLCLITPIKPAHAQGTIYIGEYEETHPYLMYNGSWQPWTGTGYTQNLARYSTDEFAYVRFYFSGWGVAIVRSIGPGFGTMEVSVDGGPYTTYSNEASVVTHNISITLADTSATPNSWDTHEIIIRNTPGSTLNIDMIDILGNPTIPMPTAWPTPDATPFLDTWDEATELAQHMINGYRWANSQTLIAGTNGNPEEFGTHGMGALDLLIVGIMLGIIFGILTSIIRRIVNRISFHVHPH